MEQQQAAAKAEEARLKATAVAAANAKRDVAKAQAEGDAASVLEEGKARAAAVECIGQAIQKHPDALKVMLVELMPNVVREVAASVNNITLDEVTVIDGGSGQAIAGAAMGRARALSESLAMLESILGVDLRQLSKNIAGNIAAKSDGHGAHSPSGETAVTSA
jgi:flotillin